MGTDQETFINVSEADEDVPCEKAHIDETSDEEAGVHEKLITELTAGDIISMEFYSEQEAIKFYTNYARDEIDEANTLLVIEQSQGENNVKYKLNKFLSPHLEHEVMHYTDENKFSCDCQMFKSRGVPCAHIITAMKHAHMNVFPDSLICKRWTKNAKGDHISSVSAEQTDSEKLFIIRSGALSADCNALIQLAGKTSEDFVESRAAIGQLVANLKKKHQPNGKHIPSENEVGDPTLVKTKGSPCKKKLGRKRKFSYCRKTGHTNPKCPKRIREEEGINEEMSHSESECNEEDMDNVDASLESNDESPSTTTERTTTNDKKEKQKGPVASCKKPKKDSCGTTQNCVKNEAPKGSVASNKKPKRDSCSTTQNCVKTSISTPLQPAGPTQPSSNFGFSNFGQTQFPHVPISPGFQFPPNLHTYHVYQQFPHVPMFPHFPVLPQVSVGFGSV
ncbi:hypothetical protein RIF29_09694 [Crotalaria pallida]|uniref:Protein FAR1-RELATED SEQUENCE n=1 Tax=Crotalaria pallida TaxID=3830 RepID=A0AAN9FS64_CROPI